MPMDWPAAQTFVAALDPAARRDLFRLLTSSSEARADVIRQFHERRSEDMTELLMLLEEHEWRDRRSSKSCSERRHELVLVPRRVEDSWRGRKGGR